MPWDKIWEVLSYNILMIMRPAWIPKNLHNPLVMLWAHLCKVVCHWILFERFDE